MRATGGRSGSSMLTTPSDTVLLRAAYRRGFFWLADDSAAIEITEELGLEEASLRLRGEASFVEAPFWPSEARPREWLRGELQALLRLHRRIAPHTHLVLAPRIEVVERGDFLGDSQSIFPRRPLDGCSGLCAAEMPALYVPKQNAIVLSVGYPGTIESLIHVCFRALDGHIPPELQADIDTWAEKQESTRVAEGSPFLQRREERRARAFTHWARDCGLVTRVEEGAGPGVPHWEVWMSRKRRAGSAEHAFLFIWEGRAASQWARPRRRWGRQAAWRPTESL